MTDCLRILVIGGGFIGKAVVRRLIADGHQVSVVTRAPRPSSIAGVDWRHGDIVSACSPDTLSDVDAIFCCHGTIAPATKLASVADALRSETLPMVDLAEMAAKNGIRRLVFVSSGGTVYGAASEIPTSEDCRPAPINTYGMTKVQTEYALLDVARQTKLRTTILRVSNPFGFDQVGTSRNGFVAAAISAALSGESLALWGDGSVVRDFVAVDDVADAASRALTDRGEKSRVLNVGSGVGTSLQEVCDIVEDVVKRPLRIAFEQGRPVDVPINVLDIGRAAEQLGWRPRIGLRQGIEEIVARLA